VEFSIAQLVLVLVFLIALSAFFSGSETALMRVNRYRLANQAKRGHRGAKLAARLLKNPDKLIGLILLGNNIVNIAATTLAANIAFKLDAPSWSVVVVLTPIILIFAELAPKTVAAYKPRRHVKPCYCAYLISIV